MHIYAFRIKLLGHNIIPYIYACKGLLYANYTYILFILNYRLGQIFW